MNTLIIGNVTSFIGCMIMVYIGFLKKKKQILIAQNVQCLFMGCGNLTLGGISGFICNIVTIIRNLVFVKWQPSLWLKVGFIGLQLLLSLSSLGAGLISWLPILSAGLFTWFLDTKNDVLLKIVIFFTMIMWLIYDLHFRNYTAAAFDVLTMVSTLIGFFMILKQK